MGGADLDPEDAQRNIAGYCVMNDWSARDVQRREMKLSMGPVKGKDFATSIGPMLVTPDELEDVRRDQQFRSRDDGDASTVSSIRARRSRMCTGVSVRCWHTRRAGTRVEPGDVIGSGTCGTGCILELSMVHGHDRYPWLQPGDVVELNVERLGTLRNRVVAGATTAAACDEHARRLPAPARRGRGAARGTAPTTSRKPGALTDADPSSGERWDRGQVWAHLAEFIPYWIAQTRPVLRGQASGEPVPFGRTKSDPERIGAIERDRHEAVSTLWASTREDIGLLRTFLSGLAPEQWLDVGLHPTRGPMPVSEINEEFLVGHLEQHADQLEGLSAQR